MKRSFQRKHYTNNTPSARISVYVLTHSSSVTFGHPVNWARRVLPLGIFTSTIPRLAITIREAETDFVSTLRSPEWAAATASSCYSDFAFDHMSNQQK